jgi:hypothetical protein
MAYLHEEKKFVHQRLCPTNILFEGKTPVITKVWRHWDSFDCEVSSENAFYSAPETKEG